MSRSIVSWQPMGDLVTLREAVDRLFEDSFVRPGRVAGRLRGAISSLPVNAYVTSEEVVVVASAPGMDSDKLEVTFDEDVLTIRGEVPGPAENIEYVLQERLYGPFSRSLRLGLPVQADKAEATFDKGVLTVMIPKAEEAKPKIIKVKAKE